MQKFFIGGGSARCESARRASVSRSATGVRRATAGRRALACAAAVGVTFAGQAHLFAANVVVLTATDAAGTSSFNSAGNWSDSQPPSPGNNYFTGVNALRSPATTGIDYVFGGDSLSIDAGGRFLMKAGASQTDTVNLILNGGLADQANNGTAGNTTTLNGTVQVQANSFLGALNLESLVINSTVTGTAGLQIGGPGVNSGSDVGTVIFGLNNSGYTGTLVIGGGVGQLGQANNGIDGGTGFVGTGTLGTSNYVLTGGSLVLDNTGTTTLSNNNDRIGDTATVSLNGGALVLKGTDFAATNTTETIGTIGGNGGTITVTFGGTNTATLTAGINHAAGNGALLVNGAGLGKDDSSTSSVARLFASSAPTLIGTSAPLPSGINLNVVDTKIVPYLIGEATASTGGVGTATGVANTFVTYTATGGFRPLNPIDEFTQNTITTGANTRITAATSTAGNASINSLLVAGGDLTVTDGQTLTVASGAVLFSTTNALKPSTTTGALAFGTNEGMVSVSSGAIGTLSAVVTGSGGLTKGGAGILILSGANTFSGGARLSQGTLRLGVAGALGSNTLTISSGTTLDASAALTITNPQIWNGDFTFSGTAALTDSGTISLGTTSDPVRTITVNGSTLTLSGVISNGTTTNSLTKGGSSTLLLSGANTYTGKTTITNGTMSVSSLNNVTGGTGSSSLGAPTTVANGTIDLGFGANAVNLIYTGTGQTTDRVLNLVGTTGGITLTQSGASGALKYLNISFTGVGAKTLTLAGSSTGTGEMAGAIVNSAVGNNTALTKTGTGLWKLSGANTFSGATTVSAGTLLYANPTIASANSAITVASGAVLAVNAGGASEFTNGASGAGTIGGVLGGTLGAGVTWSSGSVFGVDTTNAGGSLTYASDIGNSGANIRGLAKLGTGTLTVSANTTYTGATIVDNGTLAFSVDQTTPKGALTFVTVPVPTAATTVGSLDLSNASATFGLASVQSNSTSANTITIGSGKTLTLTGGLTIGVNVATATGATKSNLTVSGAGSMAITGGSVQVGVSQSTADAANNSVGSLDLSNLTGAAGFSATNLTNFNVGQGNTSDGTVTLTNTSNTISATTMNIGNSNGHNTVNAGSNLILGNGTNQINVDTLNIAVFKTNPAAMKFASTAVGPGTVTIAGKSGATTAITIANKSGQTGTTANVTGTLDLRGHVANVTAGAVQIAVENGTGGGGATGSLFFDGGTFTANSVALANKSNGSTGAVGTTGTLTISGGSFTVNSGGTFSLGTNNAGTATAGTVTGSLTVSGGALTTNADIIDSGGTNTSNPPNTSITLSGGTLDMTSHNIGGTTPIDTLNFQSGTLKNVAQINNGAGLTKSGAGTLTINGTNTYTGTTSVGTGTVLVTGSLSGSPVNVASGATLGGNGGTITAATTIATGGNLTPSAGLAGPVTTPLTLSGGVSFGSSTSKYNVAIASPTSYDEIIVGSGATATLNGATLAINDLAYGNSHLGAPGDKFWIIDGATGSTGITTAFANGSSVTGASGSVYSITYGAGSPANDPLGSGNYVLLTAVSVVPEPATLGLAGLAAVGLLARRRRSRG